MDKLEAAARDLAAQTGCPIEVARIGIKIALRAMVNGAKGAK